ncbi:MAG TPA: hypothetical protein VGF82_19535 [Terracidiphilus sp.]
MSKPLWKPGLALLAVAQFFAWSMPIQSFARQPGKRTEPAASASPIQVTADFSVPEGYPLVKDKIGVYQTPFMGIYGRPPLIAMEKLLRLAGVQDLRYELAWGKSDTYAYSQISGTASQPTIDFAPLDPFLRMLHANGIDPLLAITYNPLPLQACPPERAAGCWRTPPSKENGWQKVLKQVASHYIATLGLAGAQFEIWNEPDIRTAGSKVFFTGTPADYGALYRASITGIQMETESGAGVTQLRVGGPAIAYDIRYLTDSGLLQQPHDFLSIHAYGNYAKQIDSLQQTASEHNDHSPLYLTEYGSFPVKGRVNPLYSGHEAAVRFFADVNEMSRDSDVPKVYWAQWVDDDLGMVTYSLHTKAIFNAYRIYQTMLPVDRVRTIVPSGNNAIGTMGASDAHTAGMVVWNSSAHARAVSIHFTHLPFSMGIMRVWRIDKYHASFSDGTPESLTSGGDETHTVRDHTGVWSGTMQPSSIVYLHATDGQPSLLAANHIGRYEGDHFYFSSHPSSAYADFDPHTSIARVGMGSQDIGAAIVGNVYDLDNSKIVLRADISKSGPLSLQSVNSVFGIRIDYQNKAGAYTKSVLYTDGLYDSNRNQAFPWGTGKAVPDRIKAFAGGSLEIKVASEAPADWNGRRIILTPLLQEAGALSVARIRFTVIPQ